MCIFSKIVRKIMGMRIKNAGKVFKMFKKISGIIFHYFILFNNQFNTDSHGNMIIIVLFSTNKPINKHINYYCNRLMVVQVLIIYVLIKKIIIVGLINE